MKLYFFLGQTFFAQSVGITKEIEAKYPGSEFRAIVAARSNLMEELANINNPKFTKYDWLSSLEKQWLDTPLDQAKLKEYEKKLGSKVLRQIIIADREIGVGFVSCGVVERTDLMSLCNEGDLRWRYIVGMLDYFFEEFTSNRPDATFAYCVAGAVAFAMAAVAEHLGIAFVQPVMARVKHYHIMDDNRYWQLYPVKELYEKAIKDKSLVADKIKEAEEFVKGFRNKPVSPQDTVTWVSEIKKNNTYKGILKTAAIDIARWGAITLGLKGTQGVLRQRSGLDILKFNLQIFWNLRKTLNGKMQVFANKIDAEEYLYFPLHVDPEASTMVLADMFTDQMMVIEAIAKTMPAGMKLVVKEHIPCVGKRPKGFYERIRNMPDVILASPFMNNFELIKNAKLVCTITGTAGWEAMLLGRVPLVIGNVHYLSVGEGFVHCQNMFQMGKAIEDAMVAKPVELEALVTYIAAIMTIGIDISPDDMWFEKYADMEKRKIAVKEMSQHIINIVAKKEAGVAKIARMREVV